MVRRLYLWGKISKKPDTLKQVLAAEAGLDWPQDAITYSSLEAPPSFVPAKKYSDLSGVEALYTDPQTRLNYACPEEFAELRKLPSDIVQGYLALRKATTQLQWELDLVARMFSLPVLPFLLSIIWPTLVTGDKFSEEGVELVAHQSGKSRWIVNVINYL